MTDREKLIELLNENFTEYCNVDIIAGHCKIRAITFEVDRFADFLISNGVTLQNWIPVSERLPDTSGDYLTRCHHYRNGDWSEVVPFDVDKNYFADLDGYYYPFVTHWMPLPEPPKEENR